MSPFRCIFRESRLLYDEQPGQYPWMLTGYLDGRIPGMTFPRHVFLERGTPRGEIWGSNPHVSCLNHP